MGNYLIQSIEKYFSDLASSMPAPGGGSASALVGATGVACLEMAANFTLGKKGYEQAQPEIREILGKLAAARSRLSGLIDEDVKSYAGVSAAYKLPKNTEEEKNARREKINVSLSAAMKVPLEIMEICSSMVPTAKRLLEVCNRNLITDVGCGASFIKSAIEGAALNVEINLKALGETPETEEKRKMLQRHLSAAGIAEEIYSATVKKMGKNK